MLDRPTPGMAGAAPPKVAVDADREPSDDILPTESRKVTQVTADNLRSSDNHPRPSQPSWQVRGGGRRMWGVPDRSRPGGPARTGATSRDDPRQDLAKAGWRLDCQGPDYHPAQPDRPDPRRDGGEGRPRDPPSEGGQGKPRPGKGDRAPRDGLGPSPPEGGSRAPGGGQGPSPPGKVGAELPGGAGTEPARGVGAEPPEVGRDRARPTRWEPSSQGWAREDPAPQARRHERTHEQAPRARFSRGTRYTRVASSENGLPS